MVIGDFHENIIAVQHYLESQGLLLRLVGKKVVGLRQMHKNRRHLRVPDLGPAVVEIRRCHPRVMNVQAPVRVDLAGIQLAVIRPDLLQKKLDEISAKGQVPVIEFLVQHCGSPTLTGEKGNC